MKKSLLVVLAVAMALVGCKKEENNVDLSQNSVIRVCAAPNRAAADNDGMAAGVDRFIMQVEDLTNPSNSQTLTNGASQISRDANGIVSTQFAIKLVFGHKYNFLFWADNTTAAAYDVTDLNNVKLNVTNDGYAANLDERDAFSAAILDTVITANFLGNVTLRRPFAQLNLRATDLMLLSDEEISKMANMTMTYEAPTEFNVATGVASAPATMTVDFASIYAALADTTTVTMDYILADTMKSLVDFAFAIPALNYTRDFTNVPVQRNYRTNLIGALFTLQGTFDVVIDQNWETPDYNNTFLVNGVPAYGTLAQIIAAAPGQTLNIEMTEDLTQEGIIATNGQKIIIDMKGHTLTIDSLVGSSSTKTLGMQLLKGATVVLKNGTITSTTAKIMIQNYANLTLENMVIDGTQSANCTYALSNNCGKVNIIGNTSIKSNTVAFDVYYWTNGGYPEGAQVVVNTTGTIEGIIEVSGDHTPSLSTLLIENGIIDGAIAVSMGYDDCITIKGGKFTTTDPTSYLAEGYTVEDEGGMFVVSEIGFYADATGIYHILNAQGLEDFAAAVNGGNLFAGKTVVLDKDIDMTGVNHTPIGGLVSYPSVTFEGLFDGQNHTISNLTTSDNTANYACAGLFGSLTGSVKNVTLKNVNITSTHYAGGICAYSSSYNTNIENCHINGGTITSTPELLGTEYDNGDKVGGILGYNGETGSIKNCSVNGLTITAYRDLGGIAGATNAKIIGCSVTNTTIIQDNTNGYKTSIDTYHEILGRDLGTTPTDCTFSNVTLQTR
ncbi:MAG: hypothetical protein MJZ82_00465 [Paludibacteraceae bacterium]|nr:hypothetical protein [Paludibacteraceae bacterium]